MTYYDDQNAVVILPQAVGATDTSALSALEGLKDSYAEQSRIFPHESWNGNRPRSSSKDLMSAGTELPVLWMTLSLSPKL